MHGIPSTCVISIKPYLADEARITSEFTYQVDDDIIC